MTDADQPTVEQAALAPNGAAPASEPASQTAAPVPAADERPELAVGAAFAGGLAFALLLKRLAR
ncbi:MAG: hypothetical protein WBC33_02440 [Conexibacter sp.]